MDTVGGFKLVRRLGSGSRAEVHLGHPIEGIDGSPPQACAVKVFRAATPIASIDDEIDALARLSSPFLLSLRDLAVADDGRPVLVLARVGPVTCSRLILERQRLSAGEAVTVLAPLADAVDELARAGVVHGRIRLDRIGFDDLGTPVLFGFGHARVTGPVPEGEEAEPGRSVPPEDLDDTEALAAVARSVLEVTHASPSSAELLEFIALPFDDPARFRADLRDRLFELADPEPVVLAAGRRIPGTAVAPVVRADAAADDAGHPKVTADWLAAMHLPDWIRDFLPTSGRAGDLTAHRGAVAAVGRFLAPVRRPVWIAAGSVVLLLVAAFIVTGTGDAGEARADAADRSVTDTGDRAKETGAADRAGENGDRKDPAGDAADTAAIAGDDPALAATALLQGRADCISTLSILCLDAIDQRDSAAMEADSALIRALQEGAEERSPDLVRAVPTVAQILGGTVILSLGLPPPRGGEPVSASMLILRGEEGWRIRDLIIG